jgi:hypothetical protein
MANVQDAEEQVRATWVCQQYWSVELSAINVMEAAFALRVKVRE